MLVLALDSSTPVLTAGVVHTTRAAGAPDTRAAGAPDTDAAGTGNGVTVLAERTLTDAFAHAEQLMPLVRGALADAARAMADLDAVVTGLGPGPFTGLRVGIATAAALADGLGIPAFGIGSHSGFAAGLPGEVLVVTDARRREVYVSVHRDGTLLAGPEPITPAAVTDWLAASGTAPSTMTGPGVTLLNGVLPVAAAAAPLSAGLVRGVDLSAAPVPLEPLYLRRPDATEPSAVRKSVLGR